jgi:hypothetical protein
MLVALLGCSRLADADRGSDTSSPAPQTEAVQAHTGFVAAVNARCVELDGRKTATYRDALADGRLTIPEYLIAQSAYQPQARSFDAEVAKLAAATPRETAAQAAFAAYKTWVEKRRQVLDAAAAKGDEMAFETALEESNDGFTQAQPVRAMTAAGFGVACLSR